jgi:hypothetical protein
MGADAAAGGYEKFPEWAKKNIRAGDIVVLETTTNVWATYDIVAPWQPGPGGECSRSGEIAMHGSRRTRKISKSC